MSSLNTTERITLQCRKGVYCYDCPASIMSNRIIQSLCFAIITAGIYFALFLIADSYRYIFGLGDFMFGFPIVAITRLGYAMVFLLVLLIALIPASRYLIKL